MLEGRARDGELDSPVITKLNEVGLTKLGVNSFYDTSFGVNQRFIVFQKVLELAVSEGQVHKGILFSCFPARLFQVKVVKVEENFATLVPDFTLAVR